MRSVLVVEDSEEGQLMVKQALIGPDFKVHVASGVKQALKLLSSGEHFDMLILDLGLPDGDGLTILRHVQKEGMGPSLPVFLLSGKDELDVKVAAFDLGADDYLVKPIRPGELRARVEMRLKKSKSSKGKTVDGSSQVLMRGKLIFQLPLMRVYIKEGGQERELQLTGKEFRILYFLALNWDRPHSREELVKEVWGEDVHVLARTVDSHVCGLRKKMGKSGALVKCISGVGYQFLAGQDSNVAS